MVEFRWSKNKNRVPVIKDREIDEYAEEVIRDYKPNMLTEVAPMDYMHFIESYLGLNLQFADIYFGKTEEQILGATSFNDGDKLHIFNKEKACKDNIVLKRGSIAIDSSLTEDRMERRQLFTGLHEGSHWLLHQLYYYRKLQGQMTFFEISANAACCRKSNIEPRVRRQLETDEDFIEHQASFCASALAMPKSIIYKITPTVISEAGVKGGKILLGRDDHAIAKEQVVKGISDMFGVSRQAAEIRLRKLGIIVDSGASLIVA